MSSNQKATAWVVTSSAMGINLILGLLYSWSVIKAALVAEGWTNTEASLPYTVCVALLAFMTVFGGKLQDKFGPRVVALGGGILFGVGIFLSAFVHTPWMMVLTFLIHQESSTATRWHTICQRRTSSTLVLRRKLSQKLTS